MTRRQSIQLILVAVLFAGGAGGGGAGAGDAAAQTDDAAAQPAADDKSLVLRLKDGSIISGKLTVDHIIVDTTFGKLTVPIDMIESFTPGLDSRPEHASQILGLIEALGAEEVLKRDEAQRGLANLGLAVRELLTQYIDDDDAERKLRIIEIIDELDEVAEELETPGDRQVQPIRKRDTVVTTEFTIVGAISPQSFTVANRYGKLTVKLADIENVSRRFQAGSRTIHKSVTVAGTDVAPHGCKSTGVRLKRGQRVSIKADGTVTLTPWGNRGAATPDGAPQAGWYVPNQIHNGTLVGRIGNSGEIFKVGSKHKFTAQRAGILQLGIGVTAGQAGQNFPGQFEVKVTVRDGK